MKVCYFGIYDGQYSRNKILISGLLLNGVEVVECVSKKKWLFKYFDLIKKHWSLRKSYDVMIVGYPGFQAMILARFITSKPIIFDAFVSIYDSMVLDRAKIKKDSLRAKYLWYLDKVSMSLPEVVLFDTNEHIKFASREFGIRDDKFRRVFVGADTEVFCPKAYFGSDKFTIVSYGHYVPLQGMEYVVRSAKLLESYTDIIFKIIGDGGGKKRVVDLAKDLGLRNVIFMGNLSLFELAEQMYNADVCMGIFGNTEKAKRVIPNKVYEAIALEKPVITADSPAIRELFNEDDLFLTKISSPESIAETILKVRSNKSESYVHAKNAHNKFLQQASILKIGEGLVRIIEEIYESR